MFDWQGEYADSPMWDHRTNVLFWVETIRHALHFYVAEDNWHDEYPLLEVPSMVVPATNPETVVVSEGNNLNLYDLANHGFDVIAQVPSPDNRTRINSGKCDTSGRIWAGTTARMGGCGLAGLYRIGHDGRAVEFIGRVTCSCGLGWSLDNRTMYHIDSSARCVDIFDFDSGSGVIANRRKCIPLGHENGVPGGMCVDNEGMLWVAMNGGSFCCAL